MSNSAHYAQLKLILASVSGQSDTVRDNSNNGSNSRDILCGTHSLAHTNTHYNNGTRIALTKFIYLGTRYACESSSGSLSRLRPFPTASRHAHLKSARVSSLVSAVAVAVMRERVV